MSLTALRTREEGLKRDLAAVRAALEDAVAKARAAARAESELASSKPTDASGAYRDPAAERAQQWHADLEAGRGAAERRDKLRLDEATLLEELEKTRLEMERTGVRRNALPMLEGVPSATPCAMRWSDMRGDGSSRVCPRCKSVVVDVATLDPEAAEALLGAVPGARFHRRADGTILARDCRGVQAGRTLVWIGVAFAAVGFASCGAAVMLHTELGGTRVPVERPKLALGTASRLTIDHSFETMGPSTKVHAQLEAQRDAYAFDLTCRGASRTVERHGTVPAAVVARFLSAVEDRAPTDGVPAPCTHTDDHPRYEVLVTAAEQVVDLGVRNCSYQWFANGEPLARDPRSLFGLGRMTEHAAINGAYRALLEAMDEESCQAEANAMP